EGRDVYGEQNTIDIDNAIRRSQVELAHYELKQGMLRLDEQRAVDDDAIERVLQTICAIANNGPDRTGTILIGVSDKPADTARVQSLDGVQPRKVGSARDVVGVLREAVALGESPEHYVARWKTAISQSPLSEPLKTDVLSSLSFNDYYGLGVLVISIPRQRGLSFYGEDVYWRNGDSTMKAEGAKRIADIASRF
ncbi:AlbA family DNA-binding domain-containing protein, partial [Microbacterium sp. B24]|uniref:AlbA family DNA-binding domain-containing protein n=1 Tax=Microbacterium sp. B24 TaxID=95616 RepID=UPI0019552A46